MIRFLADENFNRFVVEGVLRLDPVVDIAIAQDEELTGAGDPAVLAWAAAAGRIVLTHDIGSMSRFAYERVARGEPMPGVFLVHQYEPRKPVIDNIILVARGSSPDEWADQVRHLPLR